MERYWTKGMEDVMPRGKRHGNLSRKASQIYEDIRDTGKYTKTQAAKIANAAVSKMKNKNKRKK